MLTSIQIKGFKSIKNIDLPLLPINVLIGANGAGKSNFITFFEFLNRLYEQKLQAYISQNGGTDKILHKGSKITEGITAKLTFNKGKNGYDFTLLNANNLAFIGEGLWYNNDRKSIAASEKEASIKTDDAYRATYIRENLENLKKYHFHDTNKNSPFNKMSHIEKDVFYLYEKGDNLAAYLYHIQQRNPKSYQLIRKNIQSIAPYFSDFFLKPNDEGYLKLFWQDIYTSTIYDATDFSDGTMRFIALTTLFLQPNPPACIIIDEPELGLHPVAIAKLAGMIQSAAARGKQVIVATQSVELLNYFEPNQIITVNQKDGESQFNRLNATNLSAWLEEYSLGDLWQRNILIGGQP